MLVRAAIDRRFEVDRRRWRRLRSTRSTAASAGTAVVVLGASAPVWLLPGTRAEVERWVVAPSGRRPARGQRAASRPGRPTPRRRAARAGVRRRRRPRQVTPLTTEVATASSPPTSRAWSRTSRTSPHCRPTRTRRSTAPSRSRRIDAGADGVRHIVYLPGTDDIGTLPWTQDDDVRDLPHRPAADRPGRTTPTSRASSTRWPRPASAPTSRCCSSGTRWAAWRPRRSSARAASFDVTNVVTAGSPTAQVRRVPRRAATCSRSSTTATSYPSPTARPTRTPSSR